MNTTELKDRLLSELKKNPYGASTRHLVNILFGKDNGLYIVRPGKYRMNQVYGYLKTLSNQGVVTTDYPGHWKLKESNQ